MPVFIGLIISVLVLTLTLNILATIITIILLSALFIFLKSFSRGWLFLLALVLLFPTIKLSNSNVFLFDLFLFLISTIGMIQLALTDKRVIKNRLTFHFFLIFLIGISYLFFGFVFNLIINDYVWKITYNMILIWFLLVGFQYFFQTQKRIKAFLSLLIAVATAHSLFGIIMFLGGWQTSNGLGISAGKNEHLIFNQTNHQLNGFLGIGFENQIGNNPLAAFLVATIIITLGFFVLNKEQEKILIKKKVGRKRKIRFLDGIQKVKRFRIKFKNRKLFRKRLFLLTLIFIQFLALVLTFSYSSLIFLGMGLITMGILTRKKNLITFAMGYLITLALIFPSIFSSVEVVSAENLSQWFGGFENIKTNWIIGEGISPAQNPSKPAFSNQGNSYFLIWKNFGIIGILIFLKIIWQFFLDIYKKYQTTEKGERIWYVIVASCFVSLTLEGLGSNILIFGPTAIVFWLFYGIILNLGKETNINDRFKKINFI